MKKPENRVEPYAMTAVIKRSRPAPFPSSAIAGVTNPIIIRGMIKVRKLPKRLLNVTKIRAKETGINCPKKIPAKMEIMT